MKAVWESGDTLRHLGKAACLWVFSLCGWHHRETVSNFCWLDQQVKEDFEWLTIIFCLGNVTLTGFGFPAAALWTGSRSFQGCTVVDLHFYQKVQWHQSLALLDQIGCKRSLTGRAGLGAVCEARLKKHWACSGWVGGTRQDGSWGLFSAG